MASFQTFSIYFRIFRLLIFNKPALGSSRLSSSISSSISATTSSCHQAKSSAYPGFINCPKCLSLFVLAFVLVLALLPAPFMLSWLGHFFIHIIYFYYFLGLIGLWSRISFFCLICGLFLKWFPWNFILVMLYCVYFLYLFQHPHCGLISRLETKLTYASTIRKDNWRDFWSVLGNCQD